MEFIVYRETEPGIIASLLEQVLELAIKNVQLQLETLKARKKTLEYVEFIDSIITGFDDDCLSAVIGVVYNAPNDESDCTFTKWAFEKLFNYLLPGTWDLGYEGKTTLDGFMIDFRLHKKISIQK